MYRVSALKGPSACPSRIPVSRVQEWAYTSAAEVYERETAEVVRQFLAPKLSLTGCIAALDSALEDLIPRLTPDQATRLRIVMLSNNEIVMNEMERRTGDLG